MTTSRSISPIADIPQPQGTCPLHLGKLQGAHILPCTHAACEDCLYEIVSSSSGHRRPEVPCPVCQQCFPFNPGHNDLYIGRGRASSTCSSISRVSTPSLNQGVKTIRMQSKDDCRSVYYNDSICVARSVLWAEPQNAIVNKQLTLKMRLSNERGQVILANESTVVHGTVIFPDRQHRNFDFVASTCANHGTEKVWSFEKVLVPNQIGKYVFEVSILGKEEKFITAVVAVKASGGKLFDIKGSPKFNNPHDIFVCGGQFVITDKGNHRVIVVDREGNLQVQFGSTPPKGLKKIGPFGVAGNPTSFFVTDNTNQCVLEFVRKTAKLRVWVKVGPSPTGIAVDKAGDCVYVADAKESNIRVFSRHKELLTTIGDKGNLQGSLNYPWFVKINSEGKLVVADRNNCRIQVFDPHNQKSILVVPLTLGGKEWHCRGLALDSLDNMYVTTRRVDSWRGWSRETVMMFSRDGTYLGNFGEFRDFDYLRGLAIDESNSTAILIDGANHRIKGYRL